MPNRCNRMEEKHSGSRPPHNYSDTLLHIRTITMYGAPLTGRLIVSKTAIVKPFHSIVQQFFTIRAQDCIAFFPPAIQMYHLTDNSLLLLNTIFHQFSYISFGLHLPNTFSYIHSSPLPFVYNRTVPSTLVSVEPSITNSCHVCTYIK